MDLQEKQRRYFTKKLLRRLPKTAKGEACSIAPVRLACDFNEPLSVIFMALAGMVKDGYLEKLPRSVEPAWGSPDVSLPYRVLIPKLKRLPKRQRKGGKR